MKYSILILSIILMVSCVPLKQYQDLKDKNDAEKTELRSLRQDNERLSVRITSYNVCYTKLLRYVKSRIF